MAWLQLFLASLLILLGYMTILWLVSLVKKDSSIVDIFWGLGFVVLSAVYYFAVRSFPTRSLLVFALVAVWGLRLTIRIFRRNWRREEDFRYRAWRQAAGSKYWWFSYFQVFLLQGGLMGLLITPVLTAQFNSAPDELTFFDLAGVLVWGVGFFFEAVGDWQLDRFKNDPANKGQLMRSGLWAYTRHPNYFGDALVWWGYFLIALGTPGGLWTLYSPMLMTWLLVRVSGMALLEKALLDSKPGYREYVQSTRAFIPWFPRRR